MISSSTSCVRITRLLSVLPPVGRQSITRSHFLTFSCRSRVEAPPRAFWFNGTL